MDYKMECEGLPLDDDLEERLLLICRRLVVGADPCLPVRMHLKQIDGRIRARVEITLPGRRLTAVVWRFDPETALEAAVESLQDSLEEGRPAARLMEGGRLSTLQ